MDLLFLSLDLVPVLVLVTDLTTGLRNPDIAHQMINLADLLAEGLNPMDLNRLLLEMSNVKGVKIGIVTPLLVKSEPLLARNARNEFASGFPKGFPN